MKLVLLGLLAFCEPCQDVRNPGHYVIVCHGTPPPPVWDADAGRYCSDLVDGDNALLPFCTNPGD